MNYPVTSLSRQSADFLARQGTGCIHSVYHRTVNLLFGEQMLSLQAAGTVLSPISLITALEPEDFCRVCSGLSVGDPVTFGAGTIRIAPDSDGVALEFLCRDAAIVDLNLYARYYASLGPECLNFLAEQMAAVIAPEQDGFAALFPTGKSGSAPDAGRDRDLASASMRIRDSIVLFRTESYTEAADSLTDLIGVGKGLTPSGDDFLCGVLAGLALTGKDAHPFTRRLRSHVRENLSRTNRISAAFLRSASEGYFSRPVLRLLDLPNAGTIRRMFREIEHTSGMDTLCGILYAWSL